MKIETAVKFVPLGKAVLFLGAGFSSELTAANGDSVPSVSQLSEIFAGKLGISPSLPLDLTSREFLRDASPFRVDEYVSLMRSILKVSACQDWHTRLLLANWRSVYTTNYDDCVEFIEKKGKIGLRTISPFSPYRFFDVDIPVVHLHGFIDDLNNENYKDALLLTRKQYASYETNHQYWDFLQKDIEKCAAIFFCGFSLSDWHIERILSSRNDIKDKTFFILRQDSKEKEELKFRLNEYGNIFYDGIDAFSKLIQSYARREQGAPEPQFIRSIDEIKPPDITSSKAAEDVHFFGHHSIELAELDRVSTSSFLVARDLQRDILASIDSGERYHLVHAEMGDGKTLIGEMVVANLVSKGWRIILLEDRKPDLGVLLRYCREADSNTIVALLETEISLRDLSQLAEGCFDKSVKILYCCRSAYFDLAHDDRKLLEKMFQIWRIPNLSPSEFTALNRIYDRFGLWGDLQGKAFTAKQRYVLNDCKGEFRSLSIGHLHQARLTRILRDEIERIEAIDASLSTVLVIAMIYSYLGRPAKLYIINKLITKNACELSAKHFTYGNFNIVYIRNGEYAVPSSIFSREILRSMFTSEYISSVIENFFVRSSEFGHHEFNDIRREVMQYGNLQRILVKPDSSPDLDTIIDLFRSFSDTGIEKNNIHFWQQYSIALYIRGDYKLAQNRLDTAKSISREMAYYDTFMLDHHQARLLLVSRARAPRDYDDHEDAFITAIMTATSLISDPDRSSERDTLYLSEHLKDAFSGESLELVRKSTRVKVALEALRQSVVSRKPNASVGAGLLRRTLKDIQKALDALS